MNNQLIFHELPFLGRKREISILENKFNKALQYQGNCLLICGKAGIGKSRLVREFLREDTKEAMCINLRLRQNFSYARDIFAEIIRSYLGKSSHTSRVITEVIDKKTYNAFSSIVPALKSYFPYEPELVKADRIEMEINEQFFRFLSNLANFAPIILSIEDIQYSNQDLLNMLKYSLQNLESLPILCILTARNKPNVIKWFNNINLEPKEKLGLTGLKDEEILELNISIFKNDLDESFFQWLERRTRGIPLFLKEYLWTLLERGIIFFDSDTQKWRSIELYSQIAIPDTITETIRLRLKGLSNKEMKFLRTAAVCGEEFNPSFAFFKPKKGILSGLSRRNIITKNKNNYAFSHPLIRDVIYEDMGEREKREIHQKIGRELLKINDRIGAANHLLCAKIKSLSLINLLLKISEDFRNIGNTPRSCFYLENALTLTKSIKYISGKKLIGIMFKYAVDLSHIGRYEKVIEVSASIIKLATPEAIDKNKLAKVHSFYAHALIRSARYQEAIKAVEEGIKLTKEAHTLIELETYKAFACKYLWQMDEALRQAIKIKNRLNRNSSPYHWYQVFNLLGSIYNGMDNYKRAIQFRRKALDAALKLNYESLIASARGNLGISLMNAGALKEGEKFLLQHQDYNIKTGRIREVAMSYLNLGCSYFYQGYLERAENEYIKGLKMCQKFGIRADLVWLYRFYGILLILKKDYKRANEYINKGIELARELKIKKSEFDLLIHKGFLLYLLKDKIGLEKLLKEIEDEFKKDYERRGEYPILEGFYELLNGKNKDGIKRIDTGIDIMRQREEYVDLCRFLYICSNQLSKYKFATSISKEYLKCADEIAHKFGMAGWLNIFQPKKGMAENKPIRVFSLGKMRIELPGGDWVTTEQWQWQKPRQLFSIFITYLFENKELDREKIGVLLWPDLPPAKITNNFHVCLSQLKKVIGGDYIGYKNRVYKLNNIWLDAIEFKDLIHRAGQMLNRGKVHPAELKLKEAIALYKGNFLEEYYDQWLDETRRKILSLYRHSLLMLGEIFLKKLKFDEAIESGQKILNLDPYDEEGHRFLIRCYTTGGERAKAINQYKKCQELFQRELNCLPSEETQQLYQELIKR